MPSLGWTEILVIGIVALVVVGPKDLPQLFLAVGKFTARARAMAREFSQAMTDAAKESGVDDLNKTLRAAANPASFGVDKIRESVGAATGLSPDRAEARDKMAEKAAEMRAAEAEIEAAELAEEPDPADLPAASPSASAETDPKDPA